MIPEDPIVAEVRATREAILAEFNYDLVAYMEDVMRRQWESGHEVIPAPPPPEEPADRDAA